MHIGRIRLPTSQFKIFFICERCGERFDSKDECSKHEREKLCRCKQCYRLRRRCKEECVYKDNN